MIRLSTFILFLCLLTYVSINTAFAGCASSRKSCHVSDDANIILFLDLNDVRNEINCASHAACANGQKLVVIPTAVQKREVRRLNLELGQIETQLRHADRCTTCPNRESEISRLAPQLEQMNARIQNYVANLMQEKLRGYSQANRKVTNFIVSGHDGGGNFGGSSGQIHSSKIKEVFAQFPNLRDGVRSVLAWGCYTTAPRMVKDEWLAAFPKVDFIGGFDRKGPLSTQSASYELMNSVLRKENQIRQSRTNQALGAALDSLKYVGHVNAAFFIKGAACNSGAERTHNLYYRHRFDANSPKRITDFDQLYRECQGKTEMLSKKADETYSKYLSCEIPLADAGSSGTTYPLRAYYEQLRDSEHCIDRCTEAEDGANGGRGQARGQNRTPAQQRLCQLAQKIPMPDSVLYLIFNLNIQRNFLKKYSRQIAEAKRGLRRLGASSISGLLPEKSDLRASNFRQVVSAKSARLKSFIEAKRRTLGAAHNSDLSYLESMQGSLEAIIVKPSGCVPFSWTDYNSQRMPEAASQCEPGQTSPGAGVSVDGFGNE